jgi:hypothetical protein
LNSLQKYTAAIGGFRWHGGRMSIGKVAPSEP